MQFMLNTHEIMYGIQFGVCKIMNVMKVMNFVSYAFLLKNRFIHLLFHLINEPAHKETATECIIRDLTLNGHSPIHSHSCCERKVEKS